jgi:hypothetical protein
MQDYPLVDLNSATVNYGNLPVFSFLVVKEFLPSVDQGN